MKPKPLSLLSPNTIHQRSPLHHAATSQLDKHQNGLFLTPNATTIREKVISGTRSSRRLRGLEPVACPLTENSCQDVLDENIPSMALPTASTPPQSIRTNSPANLSNLPGHSSTSDLLTPLIKNNGPTNTERESISPRNHTRIQLTERLNYRREMKRIMRRGGSRDQTFKRTKIEHHGDNNCYNFSSDEVIRTPEVEPPRNADSLRSSGLAQFDTSGVSSVSTLRGENSLTTKFPENCDVLKCDETLPLKLFIASPKSIECSHVDESSDGDDLEVIISHGARTLRTGNKLEAFLRAGLSNENPIDSVKHYFLDLLQSFDKGDHDRKNSFSKPSCYLIGESFTGQIARHRPQLLNEKGRPEHKSITRSIFLGTSPSCKEALEPHHPYACNGFFVLSHLEEEIIKRKELLLQKQDSLPCKSLKRRSLPCTSMFSQEQFYDRISTSTSEHADCEDCKINSMNEGLSLKASCTGSNNKLVPLDKEEFRSESRKKTFEMMQAECSVASRNRSLLPKREGIGILSKEFLEGSSLTSKSNSSFNTSPLYNEDPMSNSDVRRSTNLTAIKSEPQNDTPSARDIVSEAPCDDLTLSDSSNLELIEPAPRGKSLIPPYVRMKRGEAESPLININSGKRSSFEKVRSANEKENLSNFDANCISSLRSTTRNESKSPSVDTQTPDDVSYCSPRKKNWQLRRRNAINIDNEPKQTINQRYLMTPRRLSLRSSAKLMEQCDAYDDENYKDQLFPDTIVCLKSIMDQKYPMSPSTGKVSAHETNRIIAEKSEVANLNGQALQDGLEQARLIKKDLISEVRHDRYNNGSMQLEPTNADSNNGFNETELDNDQLKCDNEVITSVLESEVLADESTQTDSPPVLADMMKGISSRDIEKEMKIIFPSYRVFDYPCTSARIFAVMSKIFDNRKRFVLLIPLLSSLVNAEIISLQDRGKVRSSFDQKKVCFSGFDYSSTIPAVDRVSGSDDRMEANIEALKGVLQEATLLTDKGSSDWRILFEEAAKCLRNIKSCVQICDECSKTMLGYCPNKRLEKAIKHYLLELTDIRCFLSMEDSVNSHVGVRYRLGDLIGRSIRFHLRRLFNSIPEETMYLVMPEGGSRWDTAVGDRSISSVVSFALQKIDAFITLNNELIKDTGRDFVSSFFARNASSRIYSSGAGKLTLSDADLEEIVLDIKEAHIFLFGMRARKFISELILWAGVKSHIEAVGGWNPIQVLTRIFLDLKLEKVCKEEKHFSLLMDIPQFIETTTRNTKQMEKAQKFCEEGLGKLWKKFRCGTRNKLVLGKHTHIKIIADYLREGKREIFPTVASAPFLNDPNHSDEPKLA